MGEKRRGRPPYPGTFTPAEERVRQALRGGRSNAEIAASLGLSTETVKYHVANMLSKTGAADRIELATLGVDEMRWRHRSLAIGLVAIAGAGAVAVLTLLVAVFATSRDDSVSPAPEGQLAFIGEDISGGTTVYSLEPSAGAVPRRLTLTPSSTRPYMPRWSPDGRLIAFLESLPECDLPALYPTGCGRLQTVFADFPAPAGEYTAEIGMRPMLGVVQRPMWSPGSGIIAITTQDFIASTFTGGGAHIGDSLLGCLAPAWSADGKLGACAAMQGTTDVPATDIWITEVDETFRTLERRDAGGGSISPPARRIIKDGIDLDPVFSPDGKWVAWWNEDSGGTRSVWFASLAGDDPIIMNDPTTAELWTAGPGMRPGWSPDSRYLLFSSARLNGDETPEELEALRTEIVIFDVVRRKGSVVAEDGAANLYPDWSPDGERIAFISNRDGPFEIYIADKDGSGPVRITNNALTETMLDWSRK